MKVYDKPFKSFDELIDVLQNKHGLLITNKEFAKHVLQCTPYYDLVNGYKDILMTGDRYSPTTGMSHLFLIHAFDRDFQNILFEFSVIVEDYFKNILAYTIADSFGVDESVYLSYGNYLVKKAAGSKHEIRRDRVLPAFRHIATSTSDTPTSYYRLHHNHIPPWVLLKNSTFSLSTNLLTLLKRPQKQQVLSYMLPIGTPWDQRFPILLYILTLIRKGRNAIAHNLKFTSLNCSRYMNNLDKATLRYLIPVTLLSDDELDNMEYLDGIYGYIILSLCFIPDRVTKYIIISRLFNAIDLSPLMTGDFQEIGDEIKETYFNGIHVPLDLKSRLMDYLHEIFEDVDETHPD